ncbi:vegetative cell wall protein gp1-like [Pecten maximus]|uniref:vegetative cell wall protein gp1-like n=1 Tax=Pecten maximus TaxID=6579 RepID=UPI001458C103|nr:vegetative cell wall protein gp1-like [Pecten maximus]XP_033725888.1 vegetative cell wall protein gp1-like [Pecten maximus]
MKKAAQKLSLPTDEMEGDVEELLKSGNLICLLGNDGFPVAKANVTAFPCTDLYICDNEDENEWVSVMIHTKMRKSTMDFLPSNNAHKTWEEIGRNSFVSWPLHMIANIRRYDEYMDEAKKERRNAKRKLPATPPGPRRRLPFIPTQAVQHCPPRLPTPPPMAPENRPQTPEILLPTTPRPQTTENRPQTPPRPQTTENRPQTSPRPQMRPQTPPRPQMRPPTPPRPQTPENRPQTPPRPQMRPPTSPRPQTPPRPQMRPPTTPRPQTPENRPQTPPRPQMRQPTPPRPQMRPPTTPRPQTPENRPQTPLRPKMPNSRHLLLPSTPQATRSRIQEPLQRPETLIQTRPQKRHQVSQPPSETKLLKSTKGPRLHDFVEVHYPVCQGRKKTTRMFYGQVLNVENLTVKFLRKVGEKTYTWPKFDDVCNVDEEEIFKVLEVPTMDNRERLVFV